MRRALMTTLILAFAGSAAVRADSADVDKVLFTAVADNDARGRIGNTALIYVVQQGHISDTK